MISSLRLVALSLCLGALAACGEPPPPETASDAETSAPEAPPASGPAFIGAWAENVEHCELGQEADDAPLVFHADGYDRNEAHCTFATLDETGPNAWHANAACQVEGDEQSAAWDMRVEGDTLVMDGQTLTRCPDDPPPP